MPKKPQTKPTPQKTPTNGEAEKRNHHKQVCYNNRKENTLVQMEETASENQREIPNPGIRSLIDRGNQKVTYVCQGISEESKDGCWDGKGGGFPLLRDNPNKCFIKEITGKLE